MKKKKKRMISFEELMQEQELIEFEAVTQEESRQYVLNIMLTGTIVICGMLMFLEQFRGWGFVMSVLGAVMAVYLLKWNNKKVEDKENE